MSKIIGAKSEDGYLCLNDAVITDGINPVYSDRETAHLLVCIECEEFLLKDTDKRKDATVLDYHKANFE